MVIMLTIMLGKKRSIFFVILFWDTCIHNLQNITWPARTAPVIPRAPILDGQTHIYRRVD